RATSSSGSEGLGGLGGQGSGTATEIGLDERGLLAGSFAKIGILESERSKAGAAPSKDRFVQDGNLRYAPISNSSGVCAFLRIFSFNEAEPKLYIDRVAKILESLPQDRLIIDIRGNPGGTIPAGQGLIRLLKAGPLTSSTVAFRASEDIGQIARVDQFN